MKELDPLREALEKRTPGEWAWYFDRCGIPCFIGAPQRGTTLILEPVRKGMNGGSFRVNVGGVMRKIEEHKDHPDLAAIVLSVNLAPLLLRVAECAEALANCPSPEEAGGEDQMESREDACSAAWIALNAALTALRTAGAPR